MTDEVLNLKLDTLQTTVDEIKSDVREIKDESPVLRIRQLESRHDELDQKVEDKYTYLDQRWAKLIWFLALTFLALLGAYATALFR